MKYVLAIAVTALVGHALFQGIYHWNDKDILEVRYLERGWVDVRYVHRGDTLQLSMTREEFKKQFPKDSLQY